MTVSNKSRTGEYRRIVVDGEHYYGKHLLLAARGCDDNILSTDVIGGFLSDLVTEIGMTAFGAPIVERFGSGIELGITGIQLMETSLISMHTNDSARDMYLDVFSCKGFSEKLVRVAVRRTFSPTELEAQILLRR